MSLIILKINLTHPDANINLQQPQVSIKLTSAKLNEIRTKIFRI
jgi:hypothetical protein